MIAVGPEGAFFIVAQANGLGMFVPYVRALKGHLNSLLNVNPIRTVRRARFRIAQGTPSIHPEKTAFGGVQADLRYTSSRHQHVLVRRKTFHIRFASRTRHIHSLTS